MHNNNKVHYLLTHLFFVIAILLHRMCKILKNYSSKREKFLPLSDSYLVWRNSSSQRIACEWCMRTSTARTPRLRGALLVDHVARKSWGGGRGSRDASFSPGVTFGTQSSAIKAVCKNIQSTGISFYTGRRRRSRGITRPPGYITSSPGISRHDLLRSRGTRGRGSRGRTGGEGGQRQGAWK